MRVCSSALLTAVTSRVQLPVGEPRNWTTNLRTPPMDRRFQLMSLRWVTDEEDNTNKKAQGTKDWRRRGNCGESCPKTMDPSDGRRDWHLALFQLHELGWWELLAKRRPIGPDGRSPAEPRSTREAWR
jgi:hypothetical protein